jgi:hypothetical protein
MESSATTTTPREGATLLQLAPSFLDRMPACTNHDAMPPPDLAPATAGSLNAKGDCEWSNGVSCHFHFGVEFVDSTAPRPAAGELHCIFPSGTPKSPFVYGTHFTCKSGSAVSHEHEPHQNEACGASLLTALSAMMNQCDARCCDDGTLTNPEAERQEAGTLDLRPDFRICASTAEIDCSMLAGMAGHAANAPRFGAPVTNGM